MGGGLLLVALAITCSILDACLCCVGGLCPRLNCTVAYMWLHPSNSCGFIDTTHWCLVMDAMLVVGGGECQGGLCCVVVVCPRLYCTVTYIHPHNWCGFIDTIHWCR